MSANNNNPLHFLSMLAAMSRNNDDDDDGSEPKFTAYTFSPEDEFVESYRNGFEDRVYEVDFVDLQGHPRVHKIRNHRFVPRYFKMRAERDKKKNEIARAKNMHLGDFFEFFDKGVENITLYLSWQQLEEVRSALEESLHVFSHRYKFRSGFMTVKENQEQEEKKTKEEEEEKEKEKMSDAEEEDDDE